MWWNGRNNCLKLEDNAWYDTKLVIGYLELTVCVEGKMEFFKVN